MPSQPPSNPAVTSAISATLVASAGPAAWRIVLGVALAYGLFSGAALLLASPSGYATPLYPSAGLALAAALVFARWAWLGTWLGAFLANAVLSWHMGHHDAVHLFTAAAVGAGAALQAEMGALLVRRFVSQPLVLQAPRDVLRFGIWGAVVACVVSPSIATPVLVAAGLVPTSAAFNTWVTWWVGDVAGALIGAPLVLCFIGQPQADWRGRRRTLAAPLLLAMGLLAAGAWQFARLDQGRLLADFQHDADRLASDAQLRLSTPLHALQALHSTALVHGELNHEALRKASAWWLAQPQHVQSMGYAVRVALAELKAFESQMQAQDSPNFRTLDRDGGLARRSDTEVLVVQHLEPHRDNDTALGLNVLSVPAARAAVLASRDSGVPVASAGYAMHRDAPNETGIVIYQALYSGQANDPARDPARDPASDPAERQAMFRAVAFVTVVPDRALADLTPPGRQHLQWCLLDSVPGADLRRLAGPPGCEKHGTGPALFSAQRTLEVAGRMVDLRVTSPVASLPGRQGEAAWLLAALGLASAALLGALLLTVTGHSRRTETAVHLGTAELRREMVERNQAEEALRDSEVRLRSILDNVPLGVVFLDPQGYVIECNPRLCEMVGRSAESLRGQSVAEIVHDSDINKVLGHRRALLHAPQHTLMQQLRLRDRTAPTGTEALYVRMTATALCGPDGQVMRMVGVLEDINDLLRLAQADSERQKAQAENAAKSEFVSRMSHELRTPLNAMIGFAQLLGLDQKPALGPHQREWVQQIQRAGWHLLDMINETLDLARIESGHVQLTLTAVPLAPLTSACFEMLEGDAARFDIALHESLQDDDMALVGDATRLKQVLSNLLSNAVKYNRAGGEVTLTAKRINQASAALADGRPGPQVAMVEIQVGDTGLGMTPEQVAALFQPYNRLGRESSDIQGTGIGLVICRRLCALMHGSLDVASQAGVGTVFTLRLPAVPVLPTLPTHTAWQGTTTAAAVFIDSASGLGPAAADAPGLGPNADITLSGLSGLSALSAPSVHGPPAAPPPQSKQVHYIEDNLVNVEVMRGVLLQRPQIELGVSMMGLDGLAAVRMRRPDLILLDMQLPDISGMEVLRHLKQDAKLADVPVVVVSADATAAHIQEALDLGALHYITKPVEVGPFLQTIDNILDDPVTVM
jgi:PAS domain S-box-containing protein